MQHFSGPHLDKTAAHKHLTTSLTAHVADGIEIVAAGVFAADYDATPIPAPALKATSNEAT